MKFPVIYELGLGGFGAYVPDLPGCVAAGDSLDEVRELIREAISAHLQLLRDSGEALPQPSHSEVVEVFTPAA